MQNQPSVTACLTVYNASAFIEKTLQSLARQTWNNLKILVSDDCSDDDTLQIIDRTLKSDNSRFQVSKQERRLGWVENTNYLLVKVTTEFFFLCYHDDLLEPEYVEQLVSRILEAEGTVGAYCDLEMENFRDAGAKKVIRTYDVICDIDDPVERGLSVIKMEGFPWVANRGIYRTQLLERVGGLRKNLAGEYSAAFPWVLGLALEGKFIRIPRILCHKILYPMGASAQWKNSNRDRLALYLDMYNTIWRSGLNDDQKTRLMFEVTCQCKEILEKNIMV